MLYLLITYAFLSTILLSVFVSPNLAVLLTAWYTIGIVSYKIGKDESYRAISFWVIILYPIFELFVKVFIINDVIPYSWFWINRVEHFVFSALLTFLFIAMINGLRPKSLAFMWVLPFAFSAVNLFGIFNEFYEFVLRQLWHLSETSYYSDTIYDLLVNMSGALVTVGIIWVIRKCRKSE